MLPGEKEHKCKNHNSQSQQGKTFAALLRIHLAPKPRVVYALHSVENRETRAARHRLVLWTPCLCPRSRECGCDTRHGVLLPTRLSLFFPPRAASRFAIAGSVAILRRWLEPHAWSRSGRFLLA